MKDNRTLETHKICLIGNDSVGKTQLVNVIMQRGFTYNPEPTIGCEFRTRTLMIKDKNIKLQIWDTAGQERYKSLLPMYIKDSPVILICFAINNQSSFDAIDGYVDQVKNSSLNHDIILVGTKSDLEEQRCVSQEDIDAKMQQHNIEHFVSTCAKTHHNVSELFNTAAKVCSEHTKNSLTKTIENIVTQINKELTDTNSAIRTGLFTSSVFKDDEGKKQRIYKSVQKVYTLCQQAKDPNKPLTYEQACQKIHTIIHDKELRLGDSRWDRLVLWIRDLLGKLGLGVKPKQRAVLNDHFRAVDKLIPMEYCNRATLC